MMVYEAHYLSGDVVEIEVDYNHDVNEITAFHRQLEYRPEYAVFIDEDGSIHPAMSWDEFKERGATSNDFASYEEFEEWLVAVSPEFQGCVTPVALFQMSVAPYA